MKSGEKLSELSKFVIYGSGVCILLFLSAAAWICAGNRTDQKAGAGNMLIALGVILVFVFVMELMVKLTDRFPVNGNRILFLIVFLCVMAGCAWWIVNADTLPDSDPRSVYDIAVRAADNDLLPIAPTGSYMSLWPYQSGLLLYEEAVLRLIPGADHMTFQWLNLFFVALALISGYFVVKSWFASPQVLTRWCFLTAFCLPYYFYVNFMYGEIPSIGMMFFCTWMLTECLRRKRIGPGVLAVFSAVGAVAVRKNSWIFVIACVLVLGVIALQKRSRKPVILLAALLVFSFLGGVWFPKAFYERRAHNTMGEGVPAISTIAMGLQDNGGSSAGGWNGYDADLFMEYGFQEEIPKQLSKASIRESLSKMVRDPVYGLDFFCRKMVSQWCDESYNSLYATKGLFEDRTELAWKFYYGEWYPGLCRLMDWYQSLIYVGGFLFCLRAALHWVRRRRKKQENPAGSSWESLWKLVLFVTVIGGFLFSTFWEGGSRYVMPYLVMLLPYAAAGLNGQNLLTLPDNKSYNKNE